MKVQTEYFITSLFLTRIFAQNSYSSQQLTKKYFLNPSKLLEWETEPPILFPRLKSNNNSTKVG